MYKHKYLKYKNKYLQLMNQAGGDTNCNLSSIKTNDNIYNIDCTFVPPLNKSILQKNDNNVKCNCASVDNINWNCNCNKIILKNNSCENKCSQFHGFTWENQIKNKVFKLQPEKNNTDKYDIPKDKNNLDKTENISIKTTGSDCICCGDIIQFYNYNFKDKNTIIVVVYKQKNKYKEIEKILEINYSKELHKILFDELKKEEIYKYVEGVKKIPANIKSEEALSIFHYKKEQKNLYNKYPKMKIKINPKVDSSQSRVQCSFNLKDIPFKYIIYDSSKNAKKPNEIRKVIIDLSIFSSKRERGDITVKKLIEICRANKNVCKNYSKLDKQGLIDLLIKHNINFE